MAPRSARLTRALLLAAAALTCHPAVAEPPSPIDPSLQEFVQGFKGKGALSDQSKAPTPEEELSHLHVAPGLQIETIAHEPEITQPLNLHFDERGRLWVVQYIQYPFPAGLKILKYDQYLRAVYDKVPLPPPQGERGQDKITILEDRKGDGTFELKKDFLTGLNMARSVVTGRGGVFVLNPPYLLFYPDRDRDDVPDGDPQVLLSGFGLEDTHSGANSLAWGPDGWLYGAHGSTCTAEVQGVKFLGQAIWRYHPERKIFEVFAEGGGNTYSLEFDAEGRAFSGTNFGETRGMFYPQGSAGVKNWSKHGPLMNPYSFGWFEHMAHHGYAPRFAQTMIIYEGGALPQLEHLLVAPMSLQNRVMASRLLPDTSTYRTEDLDPLVTTEDRWFRPVDTKVGPDGAIYMTDWCDSRLSHVDPRDTWDKDHGRIYRLRAPGSAPAPSFDLGALPSAGLLPYLSHPNKWFRQTALRVLYDRHDATLIPSLRELLRGNSGHLALEALWALNASGGFDDETALQALGHPYPMVRYWAVRLLGDRYAPALFSSAATQPPPLPVALREKLVALAAGEPEVQVRGQLASSAKRFPGPDALPMLRELVFHAEDASDKHNPLLCWWALESKCVSDRDAVVALFGDSAVCQAPLFSQHLISRLAQRYTADRTPANLETAARLLELAPSAAVKDGLIAGMDQGLAGDRVTAVPEALQKQIGAVWQYIPHTAALISVALRLDYAPAEAEAIGALADAKANARRTLLELLSSRQSAAALPAIERLLTAATKDAERIDLLHALARYNTLEAGDAMLRLLPKASPGVRATVISSLSRQVTWAKSLLGLVEKGDLPRTSFSPGDLFALQNLHDQDVDATLLKQWGSLRTSSQAKEEMIARVRKLLTGGAAKGDPDKGKELFAARCATCHTLNGQGGKIGPELTGYERDNLDFMIPAIVDPSLAIREEYVAFLITTKQGQSFTGFLTENDPKAVTVQDLAGAKTRLAREEIATLAALPVSVMPEGLLESMSDEEIRHLFAYLTRK